MTLATTRTWPSFVLQCLGICVTLMLEQAKRGTPETSVCTFILPLNCLPSCSIDCCHFREHEHSPTTWDNRTQISLNIPLIRRRICLRSPNCKCCEKGKRWGDNFLRSSQRRLKLTAQYIHASQCHASRSSKKNCYWRRIRTSTFR